jgi:transketolase
MAIAEKALAAHFNKDGHDIVDHYTYVFLGDGCMMEGISHEACSLAGTLGLGKLIAFYDDNNISIDGEVEGWFTDDTPRRFAAYGWHVVENVDGHDADAIKAAVDAARADSDRPSLICCKTTIGFGSPNKSGKEECHGAPLGEEEIALTREALGWEHGPFVIPDEIYEGWSAKEKGAAAEEAWNEKFAAYKSAYPELAADYERRMAGELSDGWDEKADAFIAAVNEKAESIPSRKASQNTIAGLFPFTPEFMGGSADLAGSNLTFVGDSVAMRHNVEDANYINYGVREFGMTAIVNGISLHGGFVPYGATFLMFSEYARNALRMAALMKIQNIQVFTHDSIGLGEDGPTHQPVEQVATLRMMPNMTLWRPCDAVESAVAWKSAVKNTSGPTSLIFSRQNLDHQSRTAEQISNIEKGGYILRDCDGTPDAIIIATGSEVALATAAAEAMSDNNVRVVSMPCTSVFDAQDEAYRESVLPSGVRARVAVEAGVTDFWLKYVGFDGKVIGINRFGESAPAGELFKEFGFTADNVANAVKSVI